LTTERRNFIAFSVESLAILAPSCFHEDSDTNSEEVHMNINGTKRQISMLCATAGVRHRALLG
jgi:hypothetical protein